MASSSEPSLSFPFLPFDFFFTLVMLWVETVERARLRPFLSGDKGGASLLRVFGMVVEANGVAVTVVTKCDNITNGVLHCFCMYVSTGSDARITY
jgi:hypothetical protein